MKINEIKKYFIWFIVWLLSFCWVSFASDSWTIWALFENIWGYWFLKWENIKDNTVSWIKVENDTITEEDIIDTFKARDSDKLDGKDSNSNLLNKDDEIPTSNAVKTYVDSRWINDLIDWKYNWESLFIWHKWIKSTWIYNTAVWSLALLNNKTWNRNTAIWRATLTNNNSWYRNTWIWFASLYYNETWHDNIWVWHATIYKNINWKYNTAVWVSSLHWNNWSNNTAIWSSALGFNQTWYSNTAVWRIAMYKNLSWRKNVALWYWAWYNNRTWNSNVFLWNSAWFYEQNSNKLYIDNTSTSKPLIYWDFSSNLLKINWKLKTTDNITSSDTDDTVVTKWYIKNLLKNIQFDVDLNSCKYFAHWKTWKCPSWTVMAWFRTRPSDSWEWNWFDCCAIIIKWL